MRTIYQFGLFSLAAILLPQVAYAQFTDTLSNIIFIIMGLAVLAAVIMIAIGGFTYMGSDVVTQKSQAKEIILSALIGLAIIFGSYIILNTINPKLLNLNIDTSGLPQSTTSSSQTDTQAADKPPETLVGKSVLDATKDPKCRPTLNRAAARLAVEKGYCKRASSCKIGGNRAVNGGSQFAIAGADESGDPAFPLSFGGSGDVRVSASEMQTAFNQELTDNPVPGCTSA